MSELQQELTQLHEYFSSVNLPVGELQINRYMTIVNVPAWIDAEIKRVQKYSTSPNSWDREFKHLRELKATLEGRNS